MLVVYSDDMVLENTAHADFIPIQDILDHIEFFELND